MTELFGIPMASIFVACVAGLAGVLALVAYLALTNRVFFKLGVRKTIRRPGRTALVVVGLMLGTTMITAAFSTGDTMTASIRSVAMTSLGNIDELVSLRAVSSQQQAGAQLRANYFDASLFEPIRQAALATGNVDGVAPLIIEPVAVQDATSQQNEPFVVLFAIDPQHTAGFGDMRAADGRTVRPADLAAGEVFLNTKAADELGAKQGDELLVFASGTPAKVRVKSIVSYQGTGTTESALIASLSAAQALLQKPGQINHIAISNNGNGTSGAALSATVIDALQPALARAGLEADATKQDALADADEAGSVFTTAFATFGSFSVVAGVMLIFLIFVMVAAERKPEMGIARAVGTQRGHLVQMFIFEGMAYDLIAALAGSALGVAVAYAMVAVMAEAFGNFGFELTHDMQPRSLVVSYTLGVLLTFAVVTFSAWRVSVLNIVTAIRNLPEAEPQRAGVQRIPWLGLAAIALGSLFAFSGLQSLNATAFWSGASLIIIALVPLLRSAGASDRVAYSVSGFVLAAVFLAPFGTFSFILPEFEADMSIWVVGGTMAVLGATWIVMYNSNLLLDGLLKLFGRFRLMAPVVKTAVSRPLANRFRTGMAVAMFSLVVMTLVVMAIITGSMMDSFRNIDDFAGGFDIQASTLRANPAKDIPNSLAASGTLSPGQFQAISAQSTIVLQTHQTGTTTEPKDFLVRGVDDEFTKHATFKFALRAPQYASDRDVWDALARDPSLAVINANAVPRRADLGFSVGLPEFQLQGLYYEDESFTPVQVEVKDPTSGKTRVLTVVAILRESISPLTLGLLTSQRGQAEAYGELVAPTTHLFKLTPGVNPDATARELETLFLANGMDASVLANDMDDMLGSSLTFNYLLQGFMGLGLIVGVAALGVISARSVVERRQQIGVLRAIGFQKGMVELSFLMESSFIALLGIGVGTVLGLIVAWNVIGDSGSEGHMDIAFVVPWVNLALILFAAYAVSLVTTFLPARQASQVYPAEALRYE